MPKRQSAHPDNDLIDEMGEAPSQQGSAGGNLAADVGSRAEERQIDHPGFERVTGADHPEANARKGRKAISRMQGGG